MGRFGRRDLTVRIAIFGLGEAGSLIARDLASAGAEVHAFDPADVPTPDGVNRRATASDAVAGASLIMAITAAADAQTAIAQAWDRLRRGSLYADLSTAPASLKQDLNDSATMRGLAFADVALMAPVPGTGLATPALASGSGAKRYAETVNGFGGAVEVVSDEAGDAATRKLLRSVFVKGLTGVLIEALRAADAAGEGMWMRDHLAEVVSSADGALLDRLLSGTSSHAKRRAEEMEHAATMLHQLGVEPVITEMIARMLHDADTSSLPAWDPSAPES